MRLSLFLVGLLAAACGGGSKSGSAAAVPVAMTEAHGDAVLAVHRAGCARCHELAPVADEALPPPRGPALAESAGWWRSGMDLYLGQHHGGADAADLAAWVQTLATAPLDDVGHGVAAALAARGEALFGELACVACHAPGSLEPLAARTDYGRVRDFLLDPAAHRPGTPHDFALDDASASALAAWLLRSQRSEATAPVRGFAYEYYEMQIKNAGLPKFDGVEPKQKGVTEKLDVGLAARKNNFALRFFGTLDVPTAGEWTFTCGSDDSSWLWIDGKEVVRNEALAPYRRKSGTIQLDAGKHELVIAYTEAAGEELLDVLWSGPGVAEQPLPTERVTTQRSALVPAAAPAAPDAAAVERGRAAARARRCDTCHDVADAQFAALPAPAPAKPFAQLGAGECPKARGAAALVDARRAVPTASAADALRLAMRADGCASCHTRDGKGGLDAAAAAKLVEVEDLGDEGRLPPNLTGVGHRLRREWIEGVLADGLRARPYMKARMPRLSKARAAQYATWFAADDPKADQEPAFAADAAVRGAQLAGIGGRNCVTCHSFAGRKALGPQGMDLSIQHRRLRPEWFTQWLLAPQKHRPGTRMLAAWLDDGPEARAEVAAIRAWMSLGEGAPLPRGLDRADGLVLTPQERPILHGAFLKGLSARCIAVGTALRAHYAFDIEHGALAWLWRGDFVDASGTWVGRAGQLLQPRSEDRVTLTDFAVEGARRVVGRKEAANGLPVFVVAVGDAEFEDCTEPRLREGGAEFVRTLRCTKGSVTFDFAPQRRDGLSVKVVSDQVRLNAGEQVEVVYQW
ncbi:MAG: hypothetical protein RL398_695 [Planctomycetota bacterium]|jgi:cytochrome c2